METKHVITLAVVAVALFALTATAIRGVGKSGPELAAAGAETSEEKKREPIRPTRRYDVAEKTEEGINLVPQTSAVADLLHGAFGDPIDDIERVHEIVRFHVNAFGSIPPGGENVDIVRALTGGNVRQLAVIPPGHRAINEKGELVDRWGTPFHFHPVSRQVLGIRSAGPDRVLYTDDDIVDGEDSGIVVDRPPGLEETVEES